MGDMGEITVSVTSFTLLTLHLVTLKKIAS